MPVKFNCNRYFGRGIEFPANNAAAVEDNTIPSK